MDHSAKVCKRAVKRFSLPHRGTRYLALVLPALLGSFAPPAHAQTQVAAQPAAVSAGAVGEESGQGQDPRKDKKRKGPKVKGYIQFHFNQPIDTNGNGSAPSRFRVQRARLTLEGKVNGRVSYEMDIDPRSPQVAGLMRDAFVDVRLHPHHTLRLGQQKVKFGYINQRSSSALYAVNRPEMADELSRGVNLRDVGASLLGEAPLGGGRYFEYAVSVVNGAGLNVQQDNNKAKNVSGRVGLAGQSGTDRWQVGVSGAAGDMFETSSDPVYDGGYFRDFQRLGTDFLFENGRLAAYGEYAVGRHEEKARDFEETVHGYYLTLAGKSARDIGPMLRYDGIDGEGRVTAGGYYGKPQAPFRLLFNYERRTGDDRVYLWMLTRF